jgi:hypothetical protein
MGLNDGMVDELRIDEEIVVYTVLYCTRFDGLTPIDGLGCKYIDVFIMIFNNIHLKLPFLA